MILDTNKIIETVNNWLKGTDITARMKSSSKMNGGHELLALNLSGEPVKEIANRFGAEGKLILHWLLPKRDDGSCVVQDQLTGNIYTSGMVFRREAFYKDFRDREEEAKISEIQKEIIEKNGGDLPEEKALEKAQEEYKARNKDKTERTPLHLCPDLDRGTVYPAWWYDAEAKWKRFSKNILREGKDGIVHKSCSLENFIRLEAGLNAVFVSSSARSGARFDEEPQEENVNPLLVLETKRQVLIDLKAQTLGRLRIPHATHKGRLCPFQTPESDLTGLKLNLAADASFGDGGKIEKGKELLSVAVGLVPYPNHTDGPRLMMGGKNMKQAEKDIVGAEPPIVPGYLETQFIKAMNSVNTESGRRFRTPIGLNALTVIMPWRGYTYEDGLVISESLAKRLYIKESPYKYRKVINAVIYQHDLDALGIDENSLHKLGEHFKSVGKRYVYGDTLPGPGIPFFDFNKEYPNKKLPNAEIKEIKWNDIYSHHTPGVLKEVTIRGVLEKTVGSNKEKTKYHVLEITVCWNFIVERPMGLGDKLTGRNGNKGVVTKVLPDDKMPQIHFKDETCPAELIISPSSIMGRKNLGQIWEMTHSLLIKKGGERLKTILEEENIDLPNIALDDPVAEPICNELASFLAEIGTDDRGTFEISGEGVPKGTRAFAGWQYFCRLHHHAWKKLQARGVKAPYDKTTGQPMRCGTRTGQRMGEMENWSFLSHGAQDTLFAMRQKQTGDFRKTRDLFRKVLRSLGLEITEGDEHTLCFAPRKGPDVDASGEKLKDAELQKALRDFEDFETALRVNVRGRTCQEEAESIESRIKEAYPEDAQTLGNLVRGGRFFNDDGSIHFEPELMRYDTLRDALMPFALPGSADIKRAKALFAYREELVNLLKGKHGIPRLFMLGRRYNRSGRAVIVPVPELPITEVYIPAAMLIELLEGYDSSKHTLEKFGELREIRNVLNDFKRKEIYAKDIAGKIDDYLRTDSGKLWCFLIRQPSLHRHSIQAFRIRCWAEPVIGLPPFVTPGFNADFDGDTMAVFLPPYEFAKDLSRFSILENPGIVGTGKAAFADGLDLALGWWNIKDKGHWYSKLGQGQNRKGMKYSDFLPQLLKGLDPSKRGDTLHELQESVCKESTGAATLAPLEFDTLCKDMEQVTKPDDNDKDKKEKYAKAHEIAKARLEELRKEKKYENFGLFTMLNSGAKGNAEDVLHMVWAIGKVEKMKDEDYNENTDPVFIRGNFWQGLKNEELFDYSYPSRYSMAQKKLSVADAGYLTRQLAEGLYEFTVQEPQQAAQKHDCGTKVGLEITYSKKDARLRLNGVILPSLNNDIEKDLMRVAWGRVPLGLDKCLNERDIHLLAEYLKTGKTDGIDEKFNGILNTWERGGDKKLIIRSPLYCEERSTGHICPLCYGADLGTKPYDTPQLVTEGFAAGITAAQAIGERGTQLAMKRFHDVSGGDGDSNVLRDMRRLLVFGKCNSDQKTKTPLQMLLEDILGKGGQELPQALIHFEVAMAQGQGLRDIAQKSDGFYLSALANERIDRLLIKDQAEKEFTFSDTLKAIKSRLIWEGDE